MRSIYKFLSNKNNKNAIGNYKESPKTFSFKAKKTAYINRMVISIAGDKTFDKYGTLPELPNGYKISVVDKRGNLKLSLTDDELIKQAVDIGNYCYDVNETQLSGYRIVHARWSFFRSGKPLKLKKDETLQIKFLDDFTGLLAHYFNIQGYYGYF